MVNEIADPTREALALVEGSITRLAGATMELARSRAWQDVLATVDQLAALLGAEVGSSPEPAPADADPARIARFVADWVESLLLPEYLESVAPGEARYRVRLPEEARADGLGDLADFLESLALRLDLAVEGGVARLALTVGGGKRPALAAACAADRLQLDLDLGATRGDRALRLRRLTLGGQAGVALRDGKTVAAVELGGRSAGLDIEPRGPGRFVLAPEGELALRLGRAGQEVTVSVPAGTRLEMAPGRLGVQKGRLVLDGSGATAPLEIEEGRALVRRTEPRSGERHPLLRFYASAAAV